MTKKISDDCYVFLFYDKLDNEINLQVAESLEEFQQYASIVNIITWFNLTGDNLKISDFYNSEGLSFLTPKEDSKESNENNTRT